MTDLKPEDQGYEALKARLSVRWERIDGAAARKVNTILAERRDALTAIDSLLADRARMEKAHQRLVDDLVAKANEARALAADLHNKPAKAHLADPALERMAYAMAAKCDHFIEAAEIARQALGASQ